MSEKPLVTVIVPSYNHKRYILQCLDGIKNQTFQDFQWLVVDDGSKDGSQELLKEKQPYYGYELFLQENKGLSATLTDMIKNHAVGKYIANCASDDYWPPEKLQKQVSFLEDHPECAMVFGRTFWVNEKSEIISDDSSEAVKYRGGMIFNDIITQRFHPPVNCMKRRDVIAQVGYYPSNIVAEDFYLNCRISHEYMIGYIPEILGYYRVVPTQKKRDPLALLKSHEDTIQDYKSEAIYKKAMHLQYLRMFSRLASFVKYKRLAMFYMFKSIPVCYNKLFFAGLYFWVAKWERF